MKLSSNTRISNKIYVDNPQDLRQIIMERYEKNKKTINLTDVDVSKVTTFVVKQFEQGGVKSIFDSLKEVQIIDIRGWDTSNVTNMHGMFCQCTYLTEIKGIEDIDTRSNKTTRSMFYGCKYLTSLDLSNWITKELTNAAYMFAYCDWMEVIDVTGWQTNNIRDISNMFYFCENLKYIKGINDFKIPQDADTRFMIGQCEKLKTKISWYNE